MQSYFRNSITRYISIIICIFACNVNADFRFEHNNHTYDVVTTGVTWAAAVADANSKNINGVPGYLAHINDQAEDIKIFDELVANIPAVDFPNTTPPGGSPCVWIGANELATEGSWVWEDDGSHFWQEDSGQVGGAYSNWANWSFATLQGGPVACTLVTDWIGGFFTLGQAGQWRDAKEVDTLYYVVEYDDPIFNTLFKDGFEAPTE